MNTRRSFLTSLLALPFASSFIGASCQTSPTISSVEADLFDTQIVLSLIEGSVNAYFLANPNANLQAQIVADENDVTGLLRTVEQALAVATDINADNVQQALTDFQTAFNNLVQLVAQIGIQVTSGVPAGKRMAGPNGVIIIGAPTIFRRIKAKPVKTSGLYIYSEPTYVGKMPSFQDTQDTHALLHDELRRMSRDPNYLPVLPDGFKVTRLG